jgi:hypothetical protein
LSADDYGIYVTTNSTRLKQIVQDAQVRWYVTPAPGWFFISDHRTVGVKPIDIFKPTYPKILQPDDFVLQHFSLLFDQMWESSSPESGAASPISECLVDLRPLPEIVVVDFASVNRDLIQRLAKTPSLLHDLQPRAFEEVVAYLFRSRGYETILTKATRDGGKDIYAIRREDVGNLLFLIECKKYSPHRPVGVECLRALYGQVQAENATAGILVTTSYFTQPAIDFWTNFQYQMALHDFEKLKVWLESLRED